MSIVLATLEPPPDKLGVTHWSSRLLAKHLGVSDFTVSTTWQKWGLQPWRVETFKFSTDPQLEAKIHDVVDLLHEQRVVGQFEPVRAVGFELERFPDPPDRRGRQSAAFGHSQSRPMRRVARRRLQGGYNDVFDLLGRHRGRPSRTRIVDQTIEAGLHEP